MPAPFVQEPTPPKPPAPPAPTVSPDVFVVPSTALPGRALTQQDVAMLQSRRSELSRQLESATGRRREISEQIRRADDGASKAGLETRLGVLDGRIMRIETELEEVGQQLSSPDAARFAETQAPFNFAPGENPFHNVDVEPIIITFTLFVLCPIALSISRLIWKRALDECRRVRPPPIRPSASSGSSRRWMRSRSRSSACPRASAS